jgi:hypothetical protein
MLLPRFQNWIQTYYPGTKLSISEYSFSSGTNPIVDALTEADVLGIYGREGLDFANMWSVPKPTDAVAYSFRLYRNYDGAGGQFGDSSVTSTSTDQAQLSVYGALRSTDGALTVIAINKTTTPIQTTLTLANFNSTGTAKVHTYGSANMTQIVAGSAVPVVSNTVNYNFAAYSATVFVFTPAAASPAPTTTSLVSSSSQIIWGQSVAFTATVAPASGTGTPTGTVTFKDGGTQIGTGSLNASGLATFSASGLAVGSHSVTAVYSGDSNFSASTSAAVSVTVSASAKTATTTSLSASATQLTNGQSVTFTASITPKSGSGTPSGSATFLDGQTQIGTSPLSAGSSSFTSNGLSAGTHSITATYSGDATYAGSTSSPVSITVGAAPAPDYALSISKSSLTVAQGSSGSLTITVTPKNGFKQTLTLACSGLPAGGSCGFNPQNVNPSSGAVSTTLTVQAPPAGRSAILLNEPFSGPRNAALYILAMLFVGIVGVSAKSQSLRGNVRLLQATLASTVFAALLVSAGCAGLTSSQNAVQPASYVVTVTASAASAPTHTQQFTFYVKP